MNPTLRSALIGISAALAAYAGISVVSHFAREFSPAAISDTVGDTQVTPMVTVGDTVVTGGAKRVTPEVTPKVTPGSPTLTPVVTPRVSPPPWHSMPTPTPTAVAATSATR